jgi:hypothetical protein
MDRERERDGVPLEKVLAFYEEKFCPHRSARGLLRNQC